MIQSYKDLKVFQLSYSLAMDIFWTSKNFPKEEQYSLTDQIRRASRSISANIVEGWAKRKYENIFRKQLTDSFGSGQETKLWLDFARDCKYLNDAEYEKFSNICEEICKMLTGLINNWKKY
jgi:four helix bundle protein